MALKKGLDVCRPVTAAGPSRDFTGVPCYVGLARGETDHQHTLPSVLGRGAAVVQSRFAKSCRLIN
jgi:hypothetical protein